MVGIAAAVVLYYAIPLVSIVISLGAICPYSPLGVPLCQADAVTRPGTPHALMRASPVLRSLGKLAFVSYSGEGRASDIYVVNADGTGLRNLTTRERQGLSNPAWSPDGTEIALIGDHEYAHAQYLEVLDVQSGTVKDRASGDGLDLDAAWSPDGRRLAFSSAYRPDAAGAASDHADIYLLRAGPGVVKLTGNGKDNDEPSWSPDAGMIAFTSGTERNREIYAMRADGLGQRNLSRDPSNDEDPAWSPDGSRIAFVSNRGGAVQIYVMNADGSSVQRLTRTRGEKSSPAWSSDSRTIAFLDHSDHGIYLIDLVGGRPRLILTGAQSDGGLSWQHRRATASRQAAPQPVKPAHSKLCRRDGIRYEGRTTEGAEMCFTLTDGGRTLVETGFSFVRASRCPDGGVGTIHSDFEGEVDASGHLDNPDGLTGSIRGAKASGVFDDQTICRGKTFAWTAHRVP